MCRDPALIQAAVTTSRRCSRTGAHNDLRGDRRADVGRHRSITGREGSEVLQSNALPAAAELAGSVQDKCFDQCSPFVGNLGGPVAQRRRCRDHVNRAAEAAARQDAGPGGLCANGYQHHRGQMVLLREPAGEPASPRVLAGFGSKQMSFTPGTAGGHGPPYPCRPCETARIGARCSRASCSATGRRLPGPASITIAPTQAGIPSVGHTKSRAVAKPNTTAKASAATDARRQPRKDLWRVSAALRLAVYLSAPARSSNLHLNLQRLIQPGARCTPISGFPGIGSLVRCADAEAPCWGTGCPAQRRSRSRFLHMQITEDRRPGSLSPVAPLRQRGAGRAGPAATWRQPAVATGLPTQGR